MTLISYAKEKGAVKLSKVNGPNGAFISMIDNKGVVTTLPVGKKSQAGKLNEFNILITEDTKQAIATVNHYEEVETVTL